MLGMKDAISTPFHPRARGKVKAANKVIKNNFKTKMGVYKGARVDELPNVLFAYWGETYDPSRPSQGQKFHSSWNYWPYSGQENNSSSSGCGRPMGEE